MNTIVYFTLFFGLVCFVRKAHSNHIEETDMDEAEMERRRTYCIRISRVSKRDTLELRPVNCAPGFEFCFTSTTCCCEQIPEKNNSLPLAVGLGVGGFILFALLFCACFACFRRPQGLRAPPRAANDHRSANKPPFSDASSMQNYSSKYGPPPSSYYGAPSEKYGPPSSRYGYPPRGGGGDSLDSFDIGKEEAPFSVSGSLPPPPYSEHSFAVGHGPAGPVVLYKPGRGTDMSSHGYSRRSSRPSSVTSWLKTQDGARSESRRSSVGSNRSVVRNSRPVSRATSVVNAGFEPGPEADQRHNLMTIPSVRSSAGSTVAASEVIYNSVGARSQAEGAPSVGRNSVATIARNA